jgi:hypothetical protein
MIADMRFNSTRSAEGMVCFNDAIDNVGEVMSIRRRYACFWSSAFLLICSVYTELICIAGMSRFMDV